MRCFLILLLGWVSLGTMAQELPETMEYARRESGALSLDLYRPDSAVDKRTTVLYVFGGGFVMGSRSDKHNVAFYRTLAERGYTVAAIDYRLGLKGVTNVGPLNSKPVFAAVEMAVEDLSAATKFLVNNADRLGIDTARMVAMGSSAGAITVLQTDYETTRRTAAVADIPQGFRYAGVVSFAGSIFSTRGGLFYQAKPAPSLMFHGTKDNVVVYKKMQLLHIGMFGTDAITRLFHDKGWSYWTVRYEGSKHEVAEFPRHYNIDLVCDFMDMAVDKTFENQVDMTIKDRFVGEKFRLNITRKSLYDGN